jgi:hypothetical protein
MRGWSGLNKAEWDCADLAAMVEEYQPPEAFCCCFAVQPEIVATDLDIIDPIHAVAAAGFADEILGITPLVRIGLAPKCVRVYRNGSGIGSRKLHPRNLRRLWTICGLWMAPESWTTILLADRIAAGLKRGQRRDSFSNANPVRLLYY